MTSKAWPAAADRGGTPSPGEKEGITEQMSALLQSAARRRRSTVGQVIGLETLRDRQTRAKENRERRRGRLDPMFKYLFQTLSDHLKLDIPVIEEFVLDSEQHVHAIENFFAVGGSKCVMFFYQDLTMPPLEECGRVIAGVSKGSVLPRLIVTDGSDEPATGACMYFIRPKTDVPLTNFKVVDEIYFGFFNCKGDLIPSLYQTMTKMYRPALHSLENWGSLNDTAQGRKAKKNFLDSFDYFTEYLKCAQMNSDQGVQLDDYDPDKVDLQEIRNAQDCIEAAANPDIVSSLEELASNWCKEIEQLLAKSDQMRKEADDTGPHAELDHWRQLQARFSSLLDEIKSHKCRMTITILNVAKSKLLKKWKELDRRITDYANEAKDNVKFLYTLEKFCEPLYRSDPVGMIDSLGGLVNAIRMVHNISRYYNTSERMTSLFIKVTNQMVTACKSYITDDGMEKVWDQPRKEVIQKLESCIRLYQEYKDAFQRTKEKTENTPGEIPFEFSEMYIFGKFDTFCKRLMKIVTLLKHVETFSSLAESKVEGIDGFASRFNQIFGIILKKPYDVLDQRKMEFDNDFDDFTNQIHDLENNIKSFMTSCFNKVKAIIQALDLIFRFEKLNIPSLNVEEKYSVILKQFGAEIEAIRKQYQRHREDPPLPRNKPPVSGKISWARQLYTRIEEPMKVFMKHPSILKSEEARKIIRNYNRVAKVLTEYEMLYYRAWVQSVESAKHETLRAPVLVRKPGTNELLVNLDPYIHEITKESEYMGKLKLDIPDSIKVLLLTKDNLRKHFNSLVALLHEYQTIKDRIPQFFAPLFMPSLRKMEASLYPGLYMHSWTSLSLEAYFKSVKENLKELGLIVKQVTDIKTSRIDKVLSDISETVLCELPERPWTVQEFLDNSEEHTRSIALFLNRLSQTLESAVEELIQLFMSRANVSEGLDYESKISIHDMGDSTKHLTLTLDSLKHGI